MSQTWGEGRLEGESRQRNTRSIGVISGVMCVYVCVCVCMCVCVSGVMCVCSECFELSELLLLFEFVLLPCFLCVGRHRVGMLTELKETSTTTKTTTTHSIQNTQSTDSAQTVHTHTHTTHTRIRQTRSSLTHSLTLLLFLRAARGHAPRDRPLPLHPLSLGPDGRGRPGEDV